MASPIKSYSLDLGKAQSSELADLQRKAFEDRYGILSTFEQDKSIDELILRRRLFKSLKEDETKHPFLNSSGKIKVATIAQYVEEGTFWKKIQTKYALFKNGNQIFAALTKLDDEINQIGASLLKPKSTRDYFNFQKRKYSLYSDKRYLNGAVRNSNVIDRTTLVEEARSQFISGLPLLLKIIFHFVKFLDIDQAASFKEGTLKDIEVPKTQVNSNHKIELFNMNTEELTVTYHYNDKPYKLVMGTYNNSLVVLTNVNQHLEINSSDQPHMRFVLQLVMELFLLNNAATKLAFNSSNTIMTYAGFSSGTRDSTQNDMKILKEARAQGQKFPEDLYTGIRIMIVKKEGDLYNDDGDAARVHFDDTSKKWEDFIKQNPLLSQ